MQIPLQVSFQELMPSDAVEAEIRRRAEKLEQICDRITRCHVTVSQLAKRHHQGKRYSVTLDLTVPGEELAVSRQQSEEDLNVAIRETFDSARRQLEEYVERRRRE